MEERTDYTAELEDKAQLLVESSPNEDMSRRISAYNGLYLKTILNTGLFEIMFKDIPVFRINRNSGEVAIHNKKYIPFGINITETDDINKRISNINEFNHWCANRVLSIDRKYAKQILNYFGYSQSTLDSDRADIGIYSRCISLNDCFWLRGASENTLWDDVNIFKNSLNDVVFDVALTGENLTISNNEMVGRTEIVTDGKAPKAWRRENDGFYLLKGDVDGSALREVEASQILKKLGIQVVEYTLDKFENIQVSRCFCFTNEKINFVRAGVLKKWCDSNDSYFSRYIKKYQTSFDLMNIADYLIGNSDEHEDNWGFLYNDEMDIIGMNPGMDFDHSFESSENEICTPALFTRGRISQKQVALDTIELYKDVINWDADLSEFKYGDYVNKRLSILADHLGIERNIL